MATINVGNRNFTATPQVFGPASIPQKAMDEDGIVIQLTSADWTANPGRPLRLTIEHSFDDGASWRLWSDDTFTTNSFARDGSLPKLSLRTGDANGIFQPRQARVTISAPGGTVNAGAVITF